MGNNNSSDNNPTYYFNILPQDVRIIIYKIIDTEEYEDINNWYRTGLLRFGIIMGLGDVHFQQLNKLYVNYKYVYTKDYPDIIYYNGCDISIYDHIGYNRDYGKRYFDESKRR
jgi:hypothetical protein